MKKWMQALLVGLVLVAGAVSAQASMVILSSYSLDRGTTYVSKDESSYTNYEFNVSFLSAFEGFSSTFGYCVDLGQGFDSGSMFKSVEVDGDYLKAAWLVDKYATFSKSGQILTGTTSSVIISALQAAIWDVLGQYKGYPNNEYYPLDPKNDSSAAQKVYDSYVAMIAAVNGVTTFEGLGLENKFQLLTNKRSQDLIVCTDSTSPVPVPAAVWMLGTGLVGVMGMRWRQRA